MTTTTPLTDTLLKSGTKSPSRGEVFLKKRFKMYGVKSYGVYVDHTTIAEDIPSLPGGIGLFTFDLTLAGNTLGGKQIALLRADRPLPDCDGWVVASSSRASAFSLAKALHSHGQQGQIISRLYGGQTTEVTAYMDLFSGQTETLIHVNNYYNRKYRTPFPIDMRYTIRECDGTIRHAGQVIIPPGGNVFLDSRSMNLGEFQGYIRVELEIENLQSRVQPFIHFWADYLSEAGMCRNHQSGWSAWPGGTVFNRGYLPVEEHLEAIGAFYNENEKTIQPRALLHFMKAGKETSIEKDLAPIPAGHMSYQNYSELFSEVDLSNVKSAYVLVRCDDPMHRPNHYIAIKGKNQFIDTYHQTGGRALHWAQPSYRLEKKDLALYSQHGFDPWKTRLPLLEEKFEIETQLGLLSPTLAGCTEYTFSIETADGTSLHKSQVKLDQNNPIFLNLNEYARDNGIDVKGGATFSIGPAEDAESIPNGSLFLFGFAHRDYPSAATSFTGSPAEVNIPFYLSARLPMSREYDYSPLQVSDHFGPGLCNEEFDSLFVVSHSSLLRDYDTSTEYQLELVDSKGRQHILHRTIPAQYHDAFWLSEALEEANLPPEGSYTLWFKSYDVKLKPYHLLFRRSDKALSLDDGSEGTLQKEPQIGDGQQEERFAELLSMLRRAGLQKAMPKSVKEKLYRIFLTK